MRAHTLHIYIGRPLGPVFSWPAWRTHLAGVARHGTLWQPATKIRTIYIIGSFCVLPNALCISRHKSILWFGKSNCYNGLARFELESIMQRIFDGDGGRLLFRFCTARTRQLGVGGIRKKSVCQFVFGCIWIPIWLLSYDKFILMI